MLAVAMWQWVLIGTAVVAIIAAVVLKKKN